MRINESTETSGIVFVSWGGHWFAVPKAWTANFKGVGVAVVATPPPVADAEDLTVPN